MEKGKRQKAKVETIALPFTFYLFRGSTLRRCVFRAAGKGSEKNKKKS
jgi:hypothetical protein